MRNAAAIAFLLVPLLCLPLAAASQPALEGQFEGAEDIPPQEWRRMAAGKTLVYKIGGEFWALETYRPGTNQVTLQLRDGSCMNGTWEYTAPLYCFHWDVQGTACFRHARRGDDILIIEAVPGANPPLVQYMTDVTDLPLACQPAIS